MEESVFEIPNERTGPQLLLGKTDNQNILELVIDNGRPDPGNKMVALVNKSDFFNSFMWLASGLPDGGISFFDQKNKQTVAIIKDMIQANSVFVAIINPSGRAMVSRSIKIADFMNLAQRGGI